MREPNNGVSIDGIQILWGTGDWFNRRLQTHRALDKNMSFRQ